MAKENETRSSCRDVFNAFMVSDAEYEGKYEFPVLFPTYKIPNRLIAFTDALHTKDYDKWVHFYQDDAAFERIWRRPKVYLPILKRFNGVILPDFSTYRDMPLAMQIWNIYRSRAIGYWLQREGLDIIVNIRYGDERTYDICCDGVSQKCVISVGSHGTIKNSDDRKFFLKGLDHVIERLKPSAIIIYGSASDSYFFKYKEMGIQIYQFDSDTTKYYSQEVV